MADIHYVAELDLEGCTGCNLCDFACPSGAIAISDRKAAIDAARCIGCARCVDRCPEDVMWMARRDVPLKVGVEIDESLRADVCVLLERAQLLPDTPICPCLLLTTTDVAAAVASGANTMEEVGARTGLRAGCGIYCVAPALRILEASGADIRVTRGHRWYDLTLSLFDLRDGPLDGAPGSWIREDLDVFDPEARFRADSTRREDV